MTEEHVLTGNVAIELRGTGVSVFSMSPGPVRTRMTESLVESEEGRRWLPEFSELSDEEWSPSEAGARLVLRLARGDADVLSGRALHVMHDLDQLIAEADAIGAADRLVLRVT
ncbi:MAG: hypothetical protein ACRDLB_09020 [Actinomycetota bacterium]